MREREDKFGWNNPEINVIYADRRKEYVKSFLYYMDISENYAK